MSDKKFAGVNGSLSSAELNGDYNSAQLFDKLRVGKLGVYFTEGLKTKYIPYDYLERAFIRIKEVNGKLCCGSTVFQYFHLVFVHGGKEFADYISEDEKAMDSALASIHELAPDVAIGFVGKSV